MLLYTSSFLKTRQVIVLYHINIASEETMVFSLKIGAGLVEEYDRPEMLLERKSSSFAKLVAEYASRSSSSSSES